MAEPLNPPAFPSMQPLERWGDPFRGMDLRDWFAGQALGGMMASEAGIQPYPHDWAAERAYIIADQMLRARTIKDKSNG